MRRNVPVGDALRGMRSVAIEPMDLRSEAEFQAFVNLVAAAAVNKRLLMRIVAHLEGKDLAVIHEEVAALDAEFRSTIGPQLNELRANGPQTRVAPGSIPVGREEERRGHALPNEEADATQPTGASIGVDHEDRAADRPLRT